MVTDPLPLEAGRDIDGKGFTALAPYAADQRGFPANSGVCARIFGAASRCPLLAVSDSAHLALLAPPGRAPSIGPSDDWINGAQAAC